MNKKLERYEAPDVQLIDLRIESGILTVSGQENIIDNAVEDDWGTL